MRAFLDDAAVIGVDAEWRPEIAGRRSSVSLLQVLFLRLRLRRRYRHDKTDSPLRRAMKSQRSEWFLDAFSMPETLVGW